MMPAPIIAKPEPTRPLAAALRPKTLSEVYGQEHLVGPNGPIGRMALKKKFQSSVIWGLPGTGKTTIVKCLANDADAHFRQLNATNATIKDVRGLIEFASKETKRTILFLDEIHRFAKNQQDVLLPSVEDGTLILFGATTEKPKFAVNSTLLSRCVVFETKPLDPQALVSLMQRVIDHYKSKGVTVTIQKDAGKLLVRRCSGDARKLLTVLETIVEVLSDDGVVAVEHVEVAMPDKHLVFDAAGNEHFDSAHAYQESVQHSDADSAVYWLARWIASGEDPAYICRRMLITAFEDGGDNPFAILSAFAACYATEKTGLPECMIPMAHATIAAAQSGRDKTAYRAISKAMHDVNAGTTIHVPPELRAGTSGYVSVVPKGRYVSRDLVEGDREGDD